MAPGSKGGEQSRRRTAGEINSNPGGREVEQIIKAWWKGGEILYGEIKEPGKVKEPRKIEEPGKAKGRLPGRKMEGQRFHEGKYHYSHLLRER